MLDLAQALEAAQGVSVAHRPEAVVDVAEGHTHVRKTVDLAILRLPDRLAHLHEVVAIDRRGTGRDRARRALRAIPRVSRNAALGRHVFARHLEEVELRGDLEERVAVMRVAMQCPDVARDSGHQDLAGRVHQ